METLGALLFLPGTHAANTALVGRPATVIAEMAGFKVPPETRVLLARMQPSQVGREFPLSAEKLSPILSFYPVANADAAIEQCRRLLEFGGMGHTCSIHSRDEAMIRRFGQKMPAFRVCVNTSAVHGSIGYSTNLFPAMTLGCGALGGNITSDNIGPMHLLNVKRIAWEARPVEHRTVPANDRMAEQAINPATPAAEVGVSDLRNTSQIASEIANRVFSLSTRKSPAPSPATCAPPAASTPDRKTAPPAVAAFVSESDVRAAIARGEKILIGRRSIVTPSARDLGSAHDVFIETDV
jgi:acetaldehyde dehydrogenase (acetylating)